VPAVALAPLQLPLAVQLTALVLVQLSVVLLPAVILLGLAEMLTLGAKG
jgi:hypothetical protein